MIAGGVGVDNRGDTGELGGASTPNPSWGALTATAAPTLPDWLIGDPDRTLVLVACSGAKLDAAGPARDLYVGDLFRASVRWAESWGLSWRVLSAKHGIVHPDAVIEPYNERLAESKVRNVRVLRLVAGQVEAGLLGDATALVVLGGAHYVQLSLDAVGGLPVWAPLQELDRRGIGYYKAWLAANTAERVPA